MVDPYAIVRRLTGHELISPKDARLLTEAVDGLIGEIGSKDARIAELEAKNKRLTAKLSLAQCVAGAVQARAALSRTGAVKVLPRPDAVSMACGTICLEYADYDLRDEAYDWLERHASSSDDALEPAAPTFAQELARHSVELFKAQTATAPDIAAAVGSERTDLYMTPTAPEGQQPEKSTVQKEFDEILAESKGGTARLFDGTFGPEAQQEPVAYRVHAPEDEYYGTGPDRLQFHPLTQHDLNNGYRQTPLYTRPSERAVTDEMVGVANSAFVEAFSNGGALFKGAIIRGVNFDVCMRAALKAAMEAVG